MKGTKEKNTLSKRSFLFDNIFWSLIAMVWYQNLLFRCVPGMSLEQSRIIFRGMLICLVATGILSTWKNRRNNLSIAVNITIPLGIYSIIIYWNVLPKYAICAGASSLIIAILHFILEINSQNEFISTYPNEKRAALQNNNEKTHIMSALFDARTIVAISLVIIMAIPTAGTYFNDAFFKSTVTAEDGMTENTISANIETIIMLREETWSALTVQEKLNALQTVANIEAHYLGIPHELNVVANNLDGCTVASYRDKTHTIQIDMDELEYASSEEVLDSVCHEAYHAYQHRLVDMMNSTSEEYRQMLIFYDIENYDEEFRNYIDGDDDMLGYYIQSCEMDARTYAERATEDYMHRIDEYLQTREAE